MSRYHLVASAVMALGIGFCAATAAGQEANAVFDAASGYRVARYRAPVTEDAPGAKRVAYDDVVDLVKNRNAVLLDVMAAEGAGPDPVTGRWRISKPREHIPGSRWLPDVGKGVLDQALEEYFKRNLERLTCGEKDRPVVIYCLADCWMGWNAAKRAARYGYTAVHWYPEGTDGWRDWEGMLAPAEPVPLGEAAGVAGCLPLRD